jgi:hypothetical protein
MYLADSAADAYCVPADYVFDYSEENFVGEKFIEKM